MGDQQTLLVWLDVRAGRCSKPLSGEITRDGTRTQMDVSPGLRTSDGGTSALIIDRDDILRDARSLGPARAVEQLGDRFTLEVDFRGGLRPLPIIPLKRAARPAGRTLSRRVPSRRTERRKLECNCALPTIGEDRHEPPVRNAIAPIGRCPMPRISLAAQRSRYQVHRLVRRRLSGHAYLLTAAWIALPASARSSGTITG